MKINIKAIRETTSCFTRKNKLTAIILFAITEEGKQGSKIFQVLRKIDH